MTLLLSQRTTNNLSEIQISYSCTIKKEDRTSIQGSSDAWLALSKIWDHRTMEYKEQFYVLYLNRVNEVIGYHLHSTGGVAGTVVDAKQILGIAVKVNASSIILSHNHPSSNLRPSQADIDITKKIAKGAAFLDVSLLDHIIITKHSYYSFADDGILP